MLGVGQLFTAREIQPKTHRAQIWWIVPPDNNLLIMNEEDKLKFGLSGNFNLDSIRDILLKNDLIGNSLEDLILRKDFPKWTRKPRSNAFLFSTTRFP